MIQQSTLGPIPRQNYKSFKICQSVSIPKIMLIAALSTVVKTWKQPKCPSTEEWIKKMWYIYTMEYYSAIRKNKIMPFVATWMT